MSNGFYLFVRSYIPTFSLNKLKCMADVLAIFNDDEKFIKSVISSEFF